MLVEDASADWPEGRSSYQSVACLVLPAQHVHSPARQAFVEEALSFTPGHSLAAHRPLGSIVRERMKAYAALGSVRRRESGNPVRELRDIAEGPG